MYTVTWIQGNRVHSISSPSRATATRIFYITRILARIPARLWFAASKGSPELIF